MSTEKGLVLLKQNSLGCTPYCRNTPPYTHTHAHAHVCTHTHPNFQKALGTACPFLSWTELLEQDLPGQGCLLHSHPLPFLLQSQGFVRSFKGMTGGAGATR